MKLNSTEYLQAIVETAVEGIITIDNIGIVQSFNPAAEKIFGYQANDVIGNKVNMLMPFPYQQKHDTYIQDYLSTGNAKIIGTGRELSGLRKNGEIFSIWLAIGEFTEDGRHYFTGFVRDLSAEKNILDKAISYEHILEKSVNEIYLFDADTLRFMRINKGASENLQYSKNEILKLTPVDIKPEYTEEEFQKLIFPLRSGKLNKIEFTTIHQRKDGSQYPVEVHLELAEYAGKSTFSAITLDITQRRKSEELLRLAKEEFQLIFENAPTGVAVLDLGGNYTNINSALCAMLGYSKPEFLTLSYKDITHPDDIEMSSEYLHKLLKGDFTEFSIDKRYIRKDKKIVNVILNVAVVNESVALAHDAKGNPALLITHVVDNTEEIKAEEKAKVQQEQLAHIDRISMMGEMAAGMAHEVNQPLTAIDSYAQAAQKRIQEDNIDFEKLNDLLRKISKASQRAGDVISRLRAMVKQQIRQHINFDINNLIDEVKEIAKADSRAMEFRIKSELDKNLPNVTADPVQIQQVLLNLIRNAMDAAEYELDEYKEIIIHSSFLADENRIKIAVTDYGSGISPDTAEQLFNPFYTTKQNGLGMGLSICRSIIQTHGGELWYLENANKGTTFHFTLPTALE